MNNLKTPPDHSGILLGGLILVVIMIGITFWKIDSLIQAVLTYLSN